MHARPTVETEEALRRWAGRVLAGESPAIEPPRVEAAVLREFIRVNGVGPCLARRRRGGPDRLLPAGLEQNAAAAGMAREKEFVAVLNALHRRGGPEPLIFKGQALAHVLYPDPWLRPRSDIDALVPPGELEALAETLQTLGYERVVSVEGDLVMRQAGFHKHRYGMAHAWDVHWAISNRPALAEALSYNALRSTARAAMVQGVRFLVPDTVNNLLIACLHLVGHHANEPRLIWLYDIHLLTQALSEDGREKFLERASGHAELMAACRAALTLTRRDLPAAPTAELAAMLGPHGRAPQRHPSSYFGRLWEDARALDDTASRLRLARQHLFPSSGYMVRRFGIRNRWALPFWYVFRIVRAFPKLLRRR